MKKVCEVCGKEFEAKRSTARYCSGACRLKASRVSVTESPLSVTSDEPLSVTNELSVTEKVSVSSRDDIWSEDYDTSEEGFARRNKSWSLFNLKFRADTIEACKRANRDHLAEIAAHEVMRDGIEGKSAVRGVVEA